MPDNEMFKLVVNGGSFAMMVLFFVWLLFKGEPRYREMISKIESAHAATIANMVTENRLAVERLAAEHKATVDAMLRNHEVVVKSMSKECREERGEWMALFVKEGELNRASRHELGNTFQRLVAEMDPKYRARAEAQQARPAFTPPT